MTSLRDLVGAWQAQASRCDAAFDVMNVGVRRELSSVGGFATTSPEVKKGIGYCRDFWITPGDSSFASGLTRSGERCGPTGNEYVAPVHPEVGDRCFALERAFRQEAIALTEAVYAVRRHVASVSGFGNGAVQGASIDDMARRGMGPEHVALVLIREGFC